MAVRALASVAAALALALLLTGAAGAADALPAGFREEVVLEGLNNPTNVEFADDGRVFVAEKSGMIKVFDDLSDTTPTTFADLRTSVYNFWDRGLLGLALDPDFPREPYVYALYTYDAQPGGQAPYWGSPGEDSDPCPSPPGATEDGCVVTGHLSRLRADVRTNTMIEEDVLIEDWCQQYPSHTIGDLAFGKDGALYVSAGDGASFGFADYGQVGNPCGDPPEEGGTLRSQDLRTSGDPVGLDGSILRVDPETGAALPGNPHYQNADPNARRIVAYGLRNPFRFAIRPGTNEVWTSDTGWNQWEEINRLASPTVAPADNFGWPCYEGGGRQDQYDGTNLDICEDLYDRPGVARRPYFAYDHGAQVVAGEACPIGTSSVGGVAFYKGGNYPARYDGALFLADYSRRCIWAIRTGSNGLPSPNRVSTFVTGASNPVELEVGPGGDLFYVDIGDFATPNSGAIRRLSYGSANTPVAVAQATSPAYGDLPLRVTFDAAGSTGTGGLAYDWDLDGDGDYDDSTAARPEYTYSTADTYDVRLKVTDGSGRTDESEPVRVAAGDAPPEATIEAPADDLTWRVGEEIGFSGSATDEQDGPIQSSDLSWTVTLRYCSTPQQDPLNCPARQLDAFPGTDEGAFDAPDWKYPAYLEIELSARDSAGLEGTDTMVLDPETVTMDFRSVPSGLKLAVSGDNSRTPFTRTVIVGSLNSVNAPSPQTLRDKKYTFREWSDGEARAHEVVAPDTAGSTYVATYAAKRRR